MSEMIFAFLFMPGCATVAGLIVWTGTGKEAIEDDRLLRHFLFMLAICVAIGLGVSRTHTVRMRLDPQYRLQTELNAHPIYTAIKQLAPDDHKMLHDFLVLEMSRGGTLDDAFLQARPLLTKLGTGRLGFADQQTHVMWGRLTADTLRALRARDPALCYRAMSAQPVDRQTLAQGFSTENTKAFQQAIIDVYESAHKGMMYSATPRGEPVDFDEAALEYRAIQESIAQRFGEAVVNQLAKKRFPETPAEAPEQLCSARIAQLDAMLERPQAMASRLIDSILR